MPYVCAPANHGTETTDTENTVEERNEIEFQRLLSIIIVEINNEYYLRVCRKHLKQTCSSKRWDNKNVPEIE